MKNNLHKQLSTLRESLRERITFRLIKKLLPIFFILSSLIVLLYPLVIFGIKGNIQGIPAGHENQIYSIMNSDYPQHNDKKTFWDYYTNYKIESVQKSLGDIELCISTEVKLPIFIRFLEFITESSRDIEPNSYSINKNGEITKIGSQSIYPLCNNLRFAIPNIESETPILSDYITVYKSNDFEVREAKIINAENNGGFYNGPEPKLRDELRNNLIEERRLPNMIDEIYTENNEGYPFKSGYTLYFPENIVLFIKQLGLQGNSLVSEGYESIDLRVNGEYMFDTIFTDFVVDDGLHWSYTAGKLAFTYQKLEKDNNNEIVNKVSIYEYKEGQLKELSQQNSYDTAYAPNYINGILSYIAKKDNQLRIIWNDEEYLVGQYNKIKDPFCCEVQETKVITDGKLIDFYGFKDDGIYHVQAGKFD